MNDKLSIPIDNLMLWRLNRWTRYETKFSANVSLRTHYDQLIITTETKILESFNMNNKIKGIYKGDVMILVVNTSNHQIRKLKFQIKENLTQCLASLGRHFNVIGNDSLKQKGTAQTKYRDIDEILKQALSLESNQGTEANMPLSSEYKNFVKLCLLDPVFPQLVSKTVQILQEKE